MGRSYCNSVCIFLLMFTQTHGQTIQDDKDVRTQLFTTNAYNYRIRPIVNTTAAITVNVSYYLLSLNELDEKEEVLKTTGYLDLSWADSELQWNTSDYGDLGGIFVPQNEVWKPDMALKNSYSDYKQMGTNELNVFITYDGNVNWYPMQVFLSTCSVDITYFPFDVQLCELRFGAWSYVKSEVVLQSEYGLSLDQYEQNPSWDILETSVDTEDENTDSIIAFKIKLKRKSLYIMLSMVFPVLVLSLLNLFVFVLPCESGERCGYAVTVFLAFAVFLTIIEASMPENSTSVAIFSIYVLLMTAQSTIVTMIAVAFVRCSTFDQEKTAIPSLLIKLANIGKLKPCRKRSTANKVNRIDPEEKDQKTKKDLGKVNAKKKEKIYTWKEVINGLDVLCFIFFTCLTVLATVVCFAISAGVAATK